MSVTLKLTVPVLQQLAQQDDTFVLELSHAAAKEIAQQYSDAIISSEVVKDALKKIDEAIVQAQVHAGQQLEQKIGEWDNYNRTGYRLRVDVVKYVESHFEKIVQSWFERWLATKDASTMIDGLVTKYVAAKVDEITKKQVGEWLTGRSR